VSGKAEGRGSILCYNYTIRDAEFRGGRMPLCVVVFKYEGSGDAYAGPLSAGRRPGESGWVRLGALTRIGGQVHPPTPPHSRREALREWPVGPPAPPGWGGVGGARLPAAPVGQQSAAHGCSQLLTA
jgi:hypothetical protein